MIGGECDENALKISPTIMDNVSWDDPIMQEEIFGPVLPILTFEKIEDVLIMLQEKQKPLALYLFSQNKENIKLITSRCQYGGGCIIVSLIHPPPY